MAHPLNPRTHPEAQLDALNGSLEQFGDVRSLLAYRSKKFGKIVLIDGHARQSLDLARVVNVEVLTDLTDEEAEGLLLTIDPLAQLANLDEEKLQQLRNTAKADNATLSALWQSLRANDGAVNEALKKAGAHTKQPDAPEQYRVMIQCDTERQATELFKRLRGDGLQVEMKKL
jgi:hypothetical protein